MADLKRKAVRGGAVTMVSQAAGIAIQLASTVVLARLLLPDDYGVIAMVVTVTGFAGLFRDLGLSSAAIQKKELTHAQQSNLFWLNVAMGAALTVLIAACSPLVARFYGRPELTPVTAILSTGFLVGAFGTQHSAYLVRKMWFARQAAANLTGAVVSLVLSVILALRGLSFWSLVWGSLAGSVTTTILLFGLSPFRPGWLSKGSGVREMLKFGANVTAFDFVNYFHRNLDNLLIGKFCGPGPVGLYSRAYSLLMLPINNLRGPISSVGFPAMSRLQDQPAEFRHYYRKIVSVLAFLSMPLTAYLFVASGPVIALALGPQWHSVVPIFSVLATVGFIQPVITLWGMVVLSRGMGQRYLHLGIFNTACSAIGFVAGLPWGPAGVATGYAVATYATAYPMLHWAFLGTPLHMKDFFAGVARPCVASIVAAAACFALLPAVAELPPWASVPILGAGFAVLYLGVLRCLPGSRAEFSFIGRFLTQVSGRFKGFFHKTHPSR